MKILILDKFSYQAYPITDNMIEVDEQDLEQLGKTKCFDIENNCVVDYDNSAEKLKEETELKIIKLTNNLASTDYIANKLAEANAEYIVTEDKTKLIELRNKYSKELADRETWRKEIDSLQEKLKNL